MSQKSLSFAEPHTAAFEAWELDYRRSTWRPLPSDERKEMPPHWSTFDTGARWLGWQAALASPEVERLKVQVRQADERGDEAMRLFHAAADERDALRAFAKGVMRSWPHGDVDGGDLQELAQRHGLIQSEIRTERCGEACSCADMVAICEWATGVECFRHTPLLTGKAAT